MEKDHIIAVLIDADNASSKRIQDILSEVSKFGAPTIKRIYGDWTASSANSWKTELLKHSLTPIQQFAYTTGKNATDSAMIIDAMDILYTSQVTAFAIVSSDSDFTRLATRLREANKLVIGLGEKKTPPPFVAACNKFIFVENISKEIVVETKQNGEVTANKVKVKKTGANKLKADGEETLPKDILELLKSSVEASLADDGWAPLSTIGSYISRVKSDFDSRAYGHSKLGGVFKSHPSFEVQDRKSGGQSHLFIQLKP